MRYMMMLLAVLLIGCREDVQTVKPSTAEQQLNAQFEQTNKILEQYANWVLAIGERLAKPQSGYMYGSGQDCFFWDLGLRGRAYMLKMKNGSRREILIGYRDKPGEDPPSSCCDYLPYADTQESRVENLFQKWYEWARLEARHREHDSLNKMKERLERLMPKEAE